MPAIAVRGVEKDVNGGKMQPWVQCDACGEESLCTCRDALDWICPVCGCSVFINVNMDGYIYTKRNNE